jgi:hypothetical protein
MPTYVYSLLEGSVNEDKKEAIARGRCGADRHRRISCRLACGQTKVLGRACHSRRSRSCSRGNRAWTYSLPRPLASTCSMISSSCDWPAETSCGSTSHLTRQRTWIARQITEAFPWNESPRYVIRDRDQVYGAAVKNRLRAMGIRDEPIAPGSPWQNGFAERLIGPTRVRGPCDRLGCRGGRGAL